MSGLRLPYASLAPEAFKALSSLSAAMEKADLGKPLVELLFLRISQLNGCAFCVDMHARDLLAQGENLQRLNSLVSWQETTFFSARERAALAWAEALTDVATRRAPDDLFAALKLEFSDKEIAELGFVIALMNAWNRIAIGFAQPVKKAVLAVRTN